VNEKHTAGPTWAEYDSLALHYAKLGIKTADSRTLPPLVNAAVIVEIDRDPEAFDARINDMAYMLARERSDNRASLARAEGAK
jgi:hypothetical protein